MNLTCCITLMTLACGLVTPSTASADGFFRRLPDVGESATFEAVLLVTFTAEGMEAVDTPECMGTLTLQCVGKTTLDEIDHFWIEVLLALDSQTQPIEMTWKLLVPASELVDGDPIATFVRGWQASSVGIQPVEIVELTPEILNDTTTPTPVFLRAVFRGPEEETETLDQGQTVVLEGIEFRIDAAEHGHFATDELKSRTDTVSPLTGWGTWWLHDDAAFGVAKAEQHWTFSDTPPVNISFALQYTLKETGNNAVSALPDHE